MKKDLFDNLFEGAQDSLMKQALALGNSEDSNSILSYRRVVQHLSDFVPALHRQVQQASIDKGGIEFGHDAWWQAGVAGMDFSIELERRYFDRPAGQRSVSGKRRADAILEFKRGKRSVRILMEYKTSYAGTPPEQGQLEQAFEEQLIPYLSHETAQLVAENEHGTDRFFCCIAVSLRDHGKYTMARQEALRVAPDLAFALLRTPSLPSLANDGNHLCYFIFESWKPAPPDTDALSFDQWLFKLVADRLFDASANAQQPASVLPAGRSSRELCIVFGPPGSGKTRWVLDQYPNARIFAPKLLADTHYRNNTNNAASELVIDEWQHMGLSSPSGSTELTRAICGPWKKMAVIVDLGQARTDNKFWGEKAYDKIQNTVKQYQGKAAFAVRLVPLWIPLRQRQLGIAFMLWMEAVRRELISLDTGKSPGFRLTPAAAATAFRNARTLLVSHGAPPEELFDIRIIKRHDIVIGKDGVHVHGAGRADMVLRRTLHARDMDDELQAFVRTPVAVAGLEYDEVIVDIEENVYNYSNEINEILLACSRASKRLYLLVNDAWPSAAPQDEARRYLFGRYADFGIAQLHDAGGTGLGP